MSRDQLFAQWWPVIAQVLNQPLSDIKAMTVDEFDTAVGHLQSLQNDSV